VCVRLVIQEKTRIAAALSIAAKQSGVEGVKAGRRTTFAPPFVLVTAEIVERSQTSRFSVLFDDKRRLKLYSLT
jgi:hypothetical protein